MAKYTARCSKRRGWYYIIIQQYQGGDLSGEISAVNTQEHREKAWFGASSILGVSQGHKNKKKVNSLSIHGGNLSKEVRELSQRQSESHAGSFLTRQDRSYVCHFNAESPLFPGTERALRVTSRQVTSESWKCAVFVASSLDMHRKGFLTGSVGVPPCCDKRW